MNRNFVRFAIAVADKVAKTCLGPRRAHVRCRRAIARRTARSGFRILEQWIVATPRQGGRSIRSYAPSETRTRSASE